MSIKIVANDELAVILSREQIQDVLDECRGTVHAWAWEVWVETYPEEANDGTLNQFRVVMGPTVNTHPSLYFTRFYGGRAE